MEVRLKLFEDDADGSFGFADPKTIDRDSSFNAFYGVRQLVHDVFEHYHEGMEFFNGDAFMNLGGEVAAMGAFIKVYELAGMSVFEGSSAPRNSGIEDMVCDQIIGDLSNIFYEGYYRYGDTLVSHVPPQEIPEGYYSYNLTSTLTEFENRYVDTMSKPLRKSSFYDYEDYEFAVRYKKSVTLKKFNDLLVWGYKNADNLLKTGFDMLYSFIEFWKGFCYNCPAEDLKFLDVTELIVTWSDKSWSAEFVRQYPNDNLKFEGDSDPISILEELRATQYGMAI